MSGTLQTAATTQPSSPLSVRVVERVSRLFGGARSTRRSFLFRAAVVGSALTVDY